MAFVLMAIALFVVTAPLSGDEARRQSSLPLAFVLTDSDATRATLTVDEDMTAAGAVYTYAFRGVPVSVRAAGTVTADTRLAVMASFKDADIRARITSGGDGRFVAIPAGESRATFAIAFDAEAAEPPLTAGGSATGAAAFDGIAADERLAPGGGLIFKLDDTNFTVRLPLVARVTLLTSLRDGVPLGTCIARYRIDCAAGAKLTEDLKAKAYCEKRGSYGECRQTIDRCGGSVTVTADETDCSRRTAQTHIELARTPNDDLATEPFAAGETIRLTFWNIEDDTPCIDGFDTVEDMRRVCTGQFLGGGVITGPLAQR